MQIERLGMTTISVPRPPPNGGQRWWKETALADPRVREYIDERLARPDTLPGRFDELFPHWDALAGDDMEEG